MKRTAIAIKTGLILGLGALLILASCKSQDTTTAGPDNVSDSARKVQDRVDSLRKTHYLNNDLSIIFLDATSWIMKTQMALTRAEIAGNKKAMVDSLVINSTQGDTLYLTLRRMYEAGAVFATSYTEKDQYRAMREPDSSKLWLQKYFQGNTPTEALTTLQKFQNDATVINKIVRR
ncbi:hypothetical protein A4H97_00520 [Niastella yeongjuensis]|uniref:Uncharacterized protein n=1 Tax=Niastella yeongjuensis TaxID=354355 RepID=A0A1V9EW48_9BACT|nr:hypothetical protein [Niastella yeongjuensis]OQP50360.1 hypothetical protein A4H97_00520 [Niastella yeongjuensis]SEN37741.1 hypothetical protein SAMN05660816_00844 [Niastella yeongjuensis]